MQGLYKNLTFLSTLILFYLCEVFPGLYFLNSLIDVDLDNFKMEGESQYFNLTLTGSDVCVMNDNKCITSLQLCLS